MYTKVKTLLIVKSYENDKLERKAVINTTDCAVYEMMDNFVDIMLFKGYQPDAVNDAIIRKAEEIQELQNIRGENETFQDDH